MNTEYQGLVNEELQKLLKQAEEEIAKHKNKEVSDVSIQELAIGLNDVSVYIATALTNIAQILVFLNNKFGHEAGISEKINDLFNKDSK